MSSSLLLLLVLQGFWLYSSYEKAYHGLSKEVNGLFRNTVMAMRDSAMMKFIEKLPPDSLLHSGSNFIFTQRIDSPKSKSEARVQIISGQSTQQLNVFVTSKSPADSIKDILKPLMSKVQDGKLKEGNFVIRMGPDTLPMDSIRSYFSGSLMLANKQLPFSLRKDQERPDDHGPSHRTRMMRLRRPEPVNDVVANISSDTIKTDWVRTDPVNRYAASLTGAKIFVLKEITPQILFSMLLTAITTMAFLFMYRSMRAQQRLMEIKNDFISNVTHELKTPVTTVSVALEALRNFKGLENPQRTEEYLNIAQGELNRLTILTDKILKTAIFENKGVNFEPEPVDLFKTMEQVLHSMKLVFEKQKAQVTFEKTGDSFTITGGSVHLTNVIYNLLDNALKYSEGEPRISISLAENETRVTMKVTDQGIGIPKEYSKKIFEKFFRVPAGDVHNVKGYGLGLSYVESVIRSHKGKIEVDSERGKGSTFTISLPKNSDLGSMAFS
jgi:signal transduction histidine kinase